MRRSLPQEETAPYKALKYWLWVVAIWEQVVLVVDKSFVNGKTFEL
jgi:hypothetical protein